MIVDNTCMQLVNRPSQFDVMLMPNLYGNIVSNVCAGLVGGAGLVAGSNYGDRYAVFEQGTRNSGSAIAGKNLANPSGMLFAAANMLKYLGYSRSMIAHLFQFQFSFHWRLDEQGAIIKRAIINTMEKHQMKTMDIGGAATTTQFMDCVLREIEEMTPEVGFNYFIQQASPKAEHKNID